MNSQLSDAWLLIRSEPSSHAAWGSLCTLYGAGDWPWHTAYSQTQAQRCAQAISDHHAMRWESFEIKSPYWGGPADQQLTLADGWSGLSQVVHRLRKQTAAEPLDWLSWVFLARCLEVSQSRQAAAVQVQVRQAVVQALACEWLPGETGHLLAQWRLRAGDPRGALSALRAVLVQAPQRHGSWLLQAQALMQLGLVPAARESFARAAESRNPRLLTLLAEKLFINNLGPEALRVREVVVELAPEDFQAWMALSELQAKLWQIDKAEASLEKALALNPDDPSALQWRVDLSAAGHSRLQFDLDFARFEARGFDANPKSATRLLMQSLYQAHLPAQSVADLHRRVSVGIEGQSLSAIGSSVIKPEPLPWLSGRGGGRRLRVGYVSGDLHRQHPVNVFMLPILQRHDRSQIEIFIYQTGTLIDEYTRMARACADHWREAAQLGDSALRQLIVDDHIDVLVDLAGHTASHRLAVFAMRAAPVQISYLGYPHSTGMQSIDLMIADEVVAPPEHEHLFTEKIARVTGSVFCWSSVDSYPLPPYSSNARTGPVVFASFNNFLKVNDETLTVWSRILKACPDSRLVLKSAVLADPVVRQRTLDRCGRIGLDVSRLELRGPSELSLMMQEYLDVDVALDPFPYNGGTTSLQALWMGCPLVALRGANFVSRMGASFLIHLGRPEWLADSLDDYVRIAIQLALEARRRLWDRNQMRLAMRASGLCQIERHTRELENIYVSAFEDKFMH